MNECAAVYVVFNSVLKKKMSAFCLHECMYACMYEVFYKWNPSEVSTYLLIVPTLSDPSFAMPTSLVAI